MQADDDSFTHLYDLCSVDISDLEYVGQVRLAIHRPYSLRLTQSEK